jgi:hypothetical protein
MTEETYEASKNMKVFFENLLDLKKYVLEASEDFNLSMDANGLAIEIYSRLDQIIKEKGV